jgi:hypothetical protein
MAILLTLADVTDSRAGNRRSASSVSSETTTKDYIDNDTESVSPSSTISAEKFNFLNLSAVRSDCVSIVEARVHALNILRSLFRHSLLGESVTPYIAQGVIVAIQGFKGKTWVVSSCMHSDLLVKSFQHGDVR